MKKYLPIVMMALSGLLPVAATAAEGATSGKTLLELRCTQCHDVKIVLTMKKNRKQWKDTIAEMRRNGARVTGAEAGAIAGYLVKAGGKRASN